MIMNLLCKAFIAILDILLLDFYLKNIYPDIYREKTKKMNYVLYIFLFVGLVVLKSIKTYIIVYLLTSICIIFILHQWKISIINIIEKLSLFFLIKISICYITNLFFSWLFNTMIIFDYTHYASPHVFLTNILYIFFTYIILSIKIRESFNLKRFKILSIFVYIYFSITFILKNPILFFIPAIARTYIFTVIISIVALICFDRMQTKYETDKHAKEAMIQNMTKEEEFIKQLQNQQLEIRKINHNLNNILIILQAHLKNGEYDEAMEYIEQNLKIHVKAYQDLTHTGIPTLDSILNNQMYLMKEKNIEYHEDITKILHLGNVKADDLSLAISLALDNAREACEKVDTPRLISLSLQSKQTHVVLYIANSIPQGSHPHFHKTTKADKIAHGHGVKSIKEIARKYHGDVKYDIKDNQVILRIMLQK